MALSTAHKLLLSTIAIGVLVLAAWSFRARQISDRSDRSSPEAAANGSANHVQLTVWAWSTPAESLRIVATDFKGLNPGVDVRVDMLGSNMSRARFLLALSAGVGAPDVAMVEIQNVEQYAATKTLADLTFFARDYETSFPKAFWDNCVLDGKVYGIPWDLGPCGVFYKSALFHKYDIDPESIETWDDYIEAGKLLVKRSKGSTRMLPVSIGEMAHLFQMLLQQSGGQIFDDEGRIAINSVAARQALGVIRSMVKAEILANIPPHGYEMYASFSNDTIASYPKPVWFGGLIKDVATQQSAQELKWDVMRLPAMQTGGLRNSNRGGSVLVIPAQSDCQEEARKFVDFALCRVDSQLQHYQQFNLFPAFMPALNDPRLDLPDPFFSQRHVTRLFRKELDAIPTINRTPDWLRSETYLNRALGRWATTGMVIDEFLEALAQKLASRTGRQVAPSTVRLVAEGSSR